MNLKLQLALLGFACAVAGVVSFFLVTGLTGDGGSDSLVVDPEIGDVSGSSFRPPLPPGVQPSVHVAGVPVVALVAVESARSEWDTSLANVIDSPGVIRTVTTVRVVEYLKGDGPESLTVVSLGGELDGIRMVVDGLPQLSVGKRAVVFLDSPGTLPGWRLDNYYALEDGIAYSHLDDRSLPENELLEMLRAAADDPVPAPPPYPDFLPPVIHLPKSAIVAQVTVTSAEETAAGTAYLADVSELVKGDDAKTVEFTMPREYDGREVPADSMPAVGAEAVIFLADDGTLFDWYLYRDGVASSWVDEVSMPVQRLLDVLRDESALN